MKWVNDVWILIVTQEVKPLGKVSTDILWTELKWHNSVILVGQDEYRTKEKV